MSDSVIVEHNVEARMRDGTILRADVYRPADPGRYPVLMTRLPYGKEPFLSPTMRWLDPLRAARAGYAVIFQDTRGCGASGGEFAYLAQLACEGDDGYDSVEWAAALPYSDGNVGMFGLSYYGKTQWAAAAKHPPHLRAIAPAQTAFDFPLYRGGAFELGWILFWHLMCSMGVVTRRMAASGANPVEIRAASLRIASLVDGLNAHGYEALPLHDLPTLRAAGLGDLLGYMLDPGPAGVPAQDVYRPEQIEVPSLIIGGWHDCFLQPTLDSFTWLHQRGSDNARRRHLLVGPWFHGAPDSVVGEMNFGIAASGNSIGLTGDLTTAHLRWFDHWLKGINNGVDRDAPVKVFLSGEQRWLELNQWPPAQAHPIPLYLQSGGGLANTVPAHGDSASHYRFDPHHPAPTLGGHVLPAAMRAGVVDQRALSQRADVLTFTGDAFTQPLTAIGSVRATLWISSSAPDTDFVVRLLDVHPDGYMQNLADGILRARYRHSLTEPEWLVPGETYALDIDLWSVAHVFKPGHHIGVQITSSSFPRWDRNWNTADDPAWATDGPCAEQMVWHDAARSSCIWLSVVD